MSPLFLVRSVTAIADKLGLEFALFHRKRDGKALDAPEKMELLVGDVKNKVRAFTFPAPSQAWISCPLTWSYLGCDSSG